MLFFVYIVFFEQWIYMKSEEMVKYFVYIQEKGTLLVLWYVHLGDIYWLGW